MRMRQSKAMLLGLVLVLTLPACVPLWAAEPGDLAAREKPVLCWYMVCFFNTVEGYMEEMALAQANGIDAFLLDISGAAYQKNDKTGEVTKTNYAKAAERMFEAARRLDSGFKLALAPEGYVAREGLDLNVKELLRAHAKHANYFHYRGKPLFATYIGRPAKWAKPLEELREDEGIDTLWVGHFWNKRYAMPWSVETAEGFFDEAETLAGLAEFAHTTTTTVMTMNSNGLRACRKRNKVFMAGVNPNYNSANAIDRRGMEGYGTLWKGITQDGADMVGIVIWNDYNEDSNLNPARWPFGSQKHYISRDESYLDATQYYATWYKTGVRPAITQDKFYAVYRVRTKWQDKAWNAKTEAWERIRNRPYPYDQFHDDCEDNLYVSTFLTKPAEMTVQLGETTATQTLPAGTQTLAIPLTGGVPRFILTRGDKVLADVVGGKQVIAEETKENSLTDGGKHLLFRNYTYGTAIGPVVKSLKASEAAPCGSATAAALGGAKGIQTQAEEGSGIEFALSGLKTACYNLRITYSNPDENEARLTMTIDGGRSAAAGDGEEPTSRILPVTFPPTGTGKLATTSLLWSVFANTTRLRIDYQLGKMFSRLDPAGDDKGSVFIQKVELIAVEPIVKPGLKDRTVPEMVSIPGGSFTMGTDKGLPDEAPARKVTLSPFSMAKFEVTNEQFDAFMPEHRQWRDQYSWRDRDPVIYVKWLEAMAYCNWLSEKQGLEPAYVETSFTILDERRWRQLQNKHKQEVAGLKRQGKPVDGLAPPEKPMRKVKKWVLVPEASGYRLPSEAQWEYVAAGRDEQRTYVWGHTEPQKDSCHAARARGEAVNRMPNAVPAAGFLPGVVPVGSFPKDKTRDGVMDMGGNVAEWCGDWYDDYDAQDLKDPFQATESAPKYRVIRGGSWGYYNYSLRVADREYNTQVYPGYTLIGFRVVLPKTK